MTVGHRNRLVAWWHRGGQPGRRHWHFWPLPIRHTHRRDAVRYIDPEELRRQGYLQEVNRRFFHPLGLALELRVEHGRAVAVSGIWDYRDDPEGIVFGAVDADKVANIDRLLQEREEPRRQALGFFIQHVGDTPR
jgi:hypothetical protein